MTHNEIHKICKRYKIKNYTINNDGSIDVNGDVDLYDKNLSRLPLKFNYVSGYFTCSYNKLMALEGSPLKVSKDFYCSNNKLTTLEGAPLEVGGNFFCSNNKLTSLEGSPKKVGGVFDCVRNKLTTLKYAPLEVGDDFYCYNNLVELNYENYIKKTKRISKLSQL